MDNKDIKNEEPLSLPTEVKVTANNVYLYTDIDDKSYFEMQDAINKADLYAYNVERNTELSCPIFLHIDSGGGMITSGFGMYDFVKNYKRKIITIAEGICCSAATLPFLAGKERRMTDNSVFLIHDLWSMNIGKYHEIKDGTKNLDSFMKHMKDIYAKETTIREENLNSILEHDIYWDKEECQKYGILK